jgi:hypothetical protein
VRCSSFNLYNRTEQNEPALESANLLSTIQIRSKRRIALNHGMIVQRIVCRIILALGSPHALPHALLLNAAVLLPPMHLQRCAATTLTRFYRQNRSHCHSSQHCSETNILLIVFSFFTCCNPMARSWHSGHQHFATPQILHASTACVTRPTRLSYTYPCTLQKQHTAE